VFQLLDIQAQSAEIRISPLSGGTRFQSFNPRPREGGDYIYPAINDRRKVKVVVEVNVTVKKLKMIVNSVNTVFKIGMSALLDRRRYEKIR